MTRNPGRALDCASPLARLRRAAAPTASAVLFFFAESALAPAMAWARPGDRAGEARDDAKPQAKASGSGAAETPVPTSVPTPEAGVHAESGASFGTVHRQRLDEENTICDGVICPRPR